ncbi:MAG: histidine kinase [Deltaproteobacteria bacterium]|jgi:two-component system sensor histidine kinase AlgZ
MKLHGPHLMKEVALYLALAAGLTIVLSSFLGVDSTRAWLEVFAVNVVISVAIGLSLTVSYALLARVGVTVDQGWLGLVGHTVAISAGILAGTSLALFVVGLVAPSVLKAFPYSAVVQVALPVTVTIVFVTSALDRWRRRTADAERARLESELAAIHARINPHFLFNSLNTIAALIPEDAARAEDAVVELSGLLRHTLDGSKHRWVPLAQEIEATRRYLAFEGLRYGERLRVELDVAEGLEAVPVPPLVLQPLAENAVKHGVGRREGGRVSVSVRAAGELVELSVEDDGDGTSGDDGTKTAHRDLAKRLDILYGGAARVDVDRDGALGGFRVRLRLPRSAP